MKREPKRYSQWVIEQKDIDRFMEVWIDAIRHGYGLDFVCKELEYPNKQKVSDTASYLRKLGLKLPRLNIGLSGRKKLLERANAKLIELEGGL